MKDSDADDEGNKGAGETLPPAPEVARLDAGEIAKVVWALGKTAQASSLQVPLGRSPAAKGAVGGVEGRFGVHALWQPWKCCPHRNNFQEEPRRKIFG